MANFSIIEKLNDLKLMAKELSTRLRDITFTDNFSSFTEEVVEITASGSVRVRNKLQRKPKSVILLFSIGNANIGVSDVVGEEWTTDYLYIKNYGSSTASAVKLLFLRD